MGGSPKRDVADRWGGCLADAAQSKSQAFRRNRFYQIIQRIYLEGTQSKLIVRGGKDHVRGFTSDTLQKIEASFPWHLNVQKKEVGSQLVDLRQGFVGVLRLPDPRNP